MRSNGSSRCSARPRPRGGVRTELRCERSVSGGPFGLIIAIGAYSVAGIGGCAYAPVVQIMFHVSSVLNRRSIQSYGLDSSRMGAARGIAGGT